MRYIVFIILAVLFVAAANVYTFFSRDLEVARARLVGRSTLIETSFGTMEYAMLGEGEPMLTIHGAGGGFDQGLI